MRRVATGLSVLIFGTLVAHSLKAQAPGESLHDDILVTIDLPLVAELLRLAGADDDEVRTAVHAARDSGLSAAQATQVLDAELRAIKIRGMRTGLGPWIRRQRAIAQPMPELLAAIEARDSPPPLLDSEAKRVENEALQKVREAQPLGFETLAETIQAARARGETVVLKGTGDHATRVAEFSASRASIAVPAGAVDIGDEGGD